MPTSAFAFGRTALGSGAAVLAVLVCLTGCQPSAPASSSSGAASASNAPPSLPSPSTRALPSLPTIKLWLGDQEVLTEVARTPVEIQTGMMFRTNMADNTGMLFVFSRPYRAAFYMKNTKVALTAAYIDPEGQILELHDLKPLDEKAVEAATDRVQFVLEAPQGWFGRRGIGVGAVVRTQYGALRELNWATLKPFRAR